MKHKKTICFLIFAVGKANGGHYRSLGIISTALSNDFNVIILNVGYTHSKIIQYLNIENHFIYFNGFDFTSSLSKIKKIIENKKIDYFHSFDYQSLFLSKILSNIYIKPVLYTKCGGPSPKGYFPNFNYLTVFSKENLYFFKSKNKYKEADIWLIPNRVSTFENDLCKVKQLKEKYRLEKKIVFLRICRISNFYKKSIIQSIKLVNILKDNGFHVALLVVGNIQDMLVYNELKQYIDESKTINIETDNEYTLNAKEIIDVSNFVIGTGRGFMEASSCSKVMLTPSIVGDFPVLINDVNFETAFDKNFSERIEFSQSTIKTNLSEIKKLLSDEISLDNESKKSLERYRNHFSIDDGIKSYLQVYQYITYKKISFSDLFFHWLFVIKNNLGTWYRNLKNKFK